MYRYEEFWEIGEEKEEGKGNVFIRRLTQIQKQLLLLSFQQLHHFAAEGIADQHVGFGISIVMVALVLGGNFYVSPEVASFDGGDVAFEFGVFFILSGDGELGFGDGEMMVL